MKLADQLAQAIFETGGCEEGRCQLGARPCCCQERAAVSAYDAMRGLDHLGYKIWPNTSPEMPRRHRASSGTR